MAPNPPPSQMEYTSASSLTGWLSCGWKFYLEKIHGSERHPHWAAIGGSAVHKATQALDEAAFEEDRR